MINVFEQDNSQLLSDFHTSPRSGIGNGHQIMEGVGKALQETTENNVDPVWPYSEMKSFLNGNHEVEYDDEVFNDLDLSQPQVMDDYEIPKTPSFRDEDSDSDDEINRLWKMYGMNRGALQTLEVRSLHNRHLLQNDDRNYTRSPSTDLDQMDMNREPHVSTSEGTEQGPSKRGHDEEDGKAKEDPLNKKKRTRELLDVVEVQEERVQSRA